MTLEVDARINSRPRGVTQSSHLAVVDWTGPRSTLASAARLRIASCPTSMIWTSTPGAGSRPRSNTAAASIAWWPRPKRCPRLQRPKGATGCIKSALAANSTRGRRRLPDRTRTPASSDACVQTDDLKTLPACACCPACVFSLQSSRPGSPTGPGGSARVGRGSTDVARHRGSPPWHARTDLQVSQLPAPETRGPRYPRRSRSEP